MTDDQRVKRFMVRAAPSIGAHQTLETAVRNMHDHGVRVLIVTCGAGIDGVLTARDVALARTAAPEGLTTLTVADAMVPRPCVVGAEDPIASAAAALARHGRGVAVVVEGGRPVGVLSMGDALRALSGGGPAPEPEPPRAQELVARIRAEHAALGLALDAVAGLAAQVLEGVAEAEGALREQSHALYVALTAHLAMEDALLVPALRETDAFGPLRAERLAAHHREQRDVLARVLRDLDGRGRTDAEAARKIQAVVAEVRADIAHEEAAFLASDVLRDDPTTVLFTG